ncbi:hypothetical protein NDU88_004219 [Pleurodeles waltl]|uniref:Fucolectin tachylectin-4 pentraxin-1 domain-containing protein n=1 Tax=Pleurodeles waltl TaxID=8319 RepID=A0AAV7V423_PLEWA|nr:hypothetical protein NDU88_004219 [Pleurodeles waltl]
MQFVCNAEVTGNNLAPAGKASQISNYLGHNSSPAAIDGNRNSSFSGGSCSHTLLDMSPWWQVDLQELHRISSIVLVNRADCCRERLWGAEVRIGYSPDNCNPVCATITNTTSKPVITLCCGGMEGRYISVVIPGRKEYLTLCEVEIYAAEPAAETPRGCWEEDVKLAV